jgi:hypothetical protein
MTARTISAAQPSLADPAKVQRLRLLTFNMQVGMPTAHYGHYLTGAWRHLLPSKSVRRNLDRIAELARDYDAVCAPPASTRSNIWPGAPVSITGASA